VPCGQLTKKFTVITPACGPKRTARTARRASRWRTLRRVGRGGGTPRAPKRAVPCPEPTGGLRDDPEGPSQRAEPPHTHRAPPQTLGRASDPNKVGQGHSRRQKKPQARRKRLDTMAADREVWLRALFADGKSIPASHIEHLARQRGWLKPDEAISRNSPFQDANEPSASSAYDVASVVGDGTCKPSRSCSSRCCHHCRHRSRSPSSRRRPSSPRSTAHFAGSPISITPIRCIDLKPKSAFRWARSTPRPQLCVPLQKSRYLQQHGRSTSHLLSEKVVGRPIEFGSIPKCPLDRKGDRLAPSRLDSGSSAPDFLIFGRPITLHARPVG
jgi:hypothetical protein